jgi:hypothetical protein
MVQAVGIRREPHLKMKLVNRPRMLGISDTAESTGRLYSG